MLEISNTFWTVITEVFILLLPYIGAIIFWGIGALFLIFALAWIADLLSGLRPLSKGY